MDKFDLSLGIAVSVQATLHRYSEITRNPDGTPMDLESWIIRSTCEPAQPLAGYALHPPEGSAYQMGRNSSSISNMARRYTPRQPGE